MTGTAIAAPLSTDGARWTAFDSVADLHDAACQRVLAAAQSAIAERGRFLCVLAGGTTPLPVYHRLRGASVDWSRWWIYFGDERCVPTGSEERNDQQAMTAWLAQVAIPRHQIATIPAELGPASGAAEYSRRLATVGRFDFVLLGLGDDGHTASLFPGRDAGARPDSSAALPVDDAPKPPPERVTLSAARLADTHALLFLVTGHAKRDALQRWRRGDSLPATAVARIQGQADVFVEAGLLDD